MEIPGDEWSIRSPPRMENSWGGGGQTGRKNLRGGGYGYFLEPHIECFMVIRFNSKGKSKRISSSKLHIIN